AGVVKEMKVKLGDKVSEGSLLLVLEAEAAAAAPTAKQEEQPVEAKKQEQPAPVATPAVAPAAAPAPVAVQPAASGGVMDINVPDIGDFKDVEIIEVLVSVGDTVKVDQSLITVESDKASMEIP